MEWFALKSHKSLDWMEALRKKRPKQSACQKVSNIPQLAPLHTWIGRKRCGRGCLLWLRMLIAFGQRLPSCGLLLQRRPSRSLEKCLLDSDCPSIATAASVPRNGHFHTCEWRTAHQVCPVSLINQCAGGEVRTDHVHALKASQGQQTLTKA